MICVYLFLLIIFASCVDYDTEKLYLWKFIKITKEILYIHKMLTFVYNILMRS